jgi:hypothetical protein
LLLPVIKQLRYNIVDTKIGYQMPEHQEPLPKLTKQQLAQSRVIAKGIKIKEIDRLLKEYGGSPKRWAKKSSQPFVFENRLVELHWYEHHGIGRVDVKIKWLNE